MRAPIEASDAIQFLWPDDEDDDGKLEKGHGAGSVKGHEIAEHPVSN